MKLRHVVISLALLLVAAGAYVAFSVYRTVNTTIPNAYALEDVASMVVYYLHHNDDQWPRSWDDLQPIYDEHVAKYNAWSFEELQSRVIVRWDVDVERVRQLSAPPEDLISLRDGRDDHWLGSEPNTMVYEYLTQPTYENVRIPLTEDARE